MSYFFRSGRKMSLFRQRGFFYNENPQRSFCRQRMRRIFQTIRLPEKEEGHVL